MQADIIYACGAYIIPDKRSRPYIRQHKDKSQKWQSLSYHEMAFSPMFGVNTQRLLVCGESQIHSSLCHPFYKAFQVWNKKPKREGCIHGGCQGVCWLIIVQKV